MIIRQLIEILEFLSAVNIYLISISNRYFQLLLPIALRDNTQIQSRTIKIFHILKYLNKLNSIKLLIRSQNLT